MNVLIQVGDVVAAVLIILALNMVTRNYRWWLFYSATNIVFMAVTIYKGLPGLTIMGIVLSITGIRNYFIEKRKVKQMKTQKEIDKQIEALKAVRPRVKPFGAFGNDNLANLDAQIMVLEENLDSEDVWDYWPDEEGDMEIRMSADDAIAWRDDESDIEDLAEDWPLIK